VVDAQGIPVSHRGRQRQPGDRIVQPGDEHDRVHAAQRGDQRVDVRRRRLGREVGSHHVVEADEDGRQPGRGRGRAR